MGEYIQKNYKTILKYSLLFILFLFWNVFVQEMNADELWNYGFSYSLFKGEIPYLDFNMVITPFSPFIYSILFYIFGHNSLILHIENAFILVLLCYLLFKLVKNNAWYLILFLFFPLSVIYPSYNLILLLLLVLLIYLEKNNKNDYLIGFVLGLTILTKQSVGIFLILPSILYFKNKDKIIKRLIGLLIPILIFVLYLLFTNSYKQFLDLCFFGLFDFASGNGHIINLFSISTMILIIITILFIKKNPKNINNYYILMFYSINLPIFDLYHFQISLVAFLLLIFMNKNIDLKLNSMLITICSIIGIGLITFFSNYKSLNNLVFPNDLNNFQYRNISKVYIQKTKKLNKFIHKNKEVIFLDYNSYYLKIINDLPINYLDLINSGNWGYDGSNKLLKVIKERKDAVYVVPKIDLEQQTDKKVVKYVIDNGKKIGSILSYNLYTLE